MAMFLATFARNIGRQSIKVHAGLLCMPFVRGAKLYVPEKAARPFEEMIPNPPGVLWTRELDEWFEELVHEAMPEQPPPPPAPITHVGSLKLRPLDQQGRAYSVGRRKTAHARVWLQPGSGMITVNNKPLSVYFVREFCREHIIAPFDATETMGQFDVTADVHGGGHSGQAGAIRLGISRALMQYDYNLRPALKAAGMVTRDPRMVERKKPGLLKARKAPMWHKR